MKPKLKRKLEKNDWPSVGEIANVIMKEMGINKTEAKEFIKVTGTRLVRIHVDVTSTYTRMQADERAKGIIERSLTHRATFTTRGDAERYKQSVKHLLDAETVCTIIEE